MGIIKRQTIKGSFYSYIGIVLGFINTAILFPRLLEKEEIGLIAIIISFVQILSQTSSLGFGGVTSRVFPYFRNKKKKHNGFIFLVSIVSLVGFIVSSAIFILFHDSFLNSDIEKSKLLSDFWWYIIPVSFFTLYYGVFHSYNRMLYNVSFGLFFKEIFVRVMIFVGIIFYYLNIFDFSSFLLFYFVSYISPSFFIVLLLIKRKELSFSPKIKFIRRKLKMIMINISAFTLFTGFSGFIIGNIDKIMVLQLLGLEKTGIYSIAFFFGSFIKKTLVAISGISSTVLAESWKKKDVEKIHRIYKRSSLNQFIIAVFLFLIIWLNIDSIFMIMTENYIEGKFVILYIGIAAVVEMSIGLNPVIITTSKSYRYNAYFLMILVIIAIILNYIFIPIYGITGAAIASMISTIIISILRFLFLWIKYKLQVFNYKFLIVIAIGSISFFLPHWLINFDNFIVNLFCKSIIFSAIFGLSIINLRLSEDLNSIKLTNYINFRNKK